MVYDRGKYLSTKIKSHLAKAGDANTKYFSTVIKERAHRKNISELTALNGTVLKDKMQIQEIINFYQALMGTTCTSLSAVNKQVMRLGPVVSHSQQLQLCRELTDQEIYDGLCSIGDDTGVDGYNAKFLKKAWPVIH